jgi:isopentenyl-diphosphate Delta-isomerase
MNKMPLVDVVDRDNQPLGYSVEVNEATRRGLWFRAVHIVVYTPDGHVLVERRSHRILFYPDHLDISLGGIVDSGETPAATALRELHEELGLSATAKRLELLSINRYNRYWPSYRRTTRNIVYHYGIEMPTARVPLHIQRSEVAEARFLTLASARQLVHKHQWPGFGRLEAKYAMYEHLLDEIEQRLTSSAPTHTRNF